MKAQQYITISKTQPVSTLYYEMGRSLFIKGDYIKAVEFLQNALNNNAENEIPNSDILLTIATVYTEAGDQGNSVKPALLATTYTPEIITRVLDIINTIPQDSIPGETIDWIIKNWYPVISHFTTFNNDQKAALHKFMGSIYQINHDELHSTEHFDIAGDLLHERGKTFYWDGKYNEACNYFESAAGIKKGFVMNYWYWADALYLKSYIPEKPYSDEADLKKAAEVWQTGRSFAKPQKNDAWAYIVKERILTQQNSVDGFTKGNENLDQLREAWLILEDALLLDNTSLNAWRDLANITRLLGLNHVSLEATYKALAIDPNYQFSLEDLALNLLDISETEKAREILNRFINDPKTNATFYYSWLAISYFIENNYKEAIEEINKYLSHNPEDDWALNFLMNCFWRISKQREAIEIADKILLLIENGTKTATLTHGYCFFIKGNIEQAIAIAESTAKNPDQYLNALEDLQFYYLYKDDINASGKCIDSLLLLSDRTFQLKDMIHKNELFLKMKRKEKNDNNQEIINAIRNKDTGFIARINKKLLSLEKENYSYFNELAVLLEKNPEYNHEGSTGWIAAKAAYSRLTVEYGDPMGAFDIYNQLKKYEAQLPDVNDGFEKTASQLLINAIRECNPSAFSNAIHLIKNNPRIYKENFLSDSLPETIVDEIYTSNDDAGYYWKINAFIDDFTRNQTINDPQFKDLFIGLKNQLHKKIEERYNFSYQAKIKHEVTPVMLEMSEALIPSTEEEKNNWSFIRNDIEKLEKTIKSETGIDVPAIIVRPNQYLTGFEYQFVLEETPIIRYVETPKTIEDVLNEAIINLKIFLLKNLSYFVDPDYLYKLLQDLKKVDSDTASIINRLFTNEPKKLNRFTKLIQRLLNEMVPVTDWKSILISANQTGLLHDDVHIDVREARLALKPYLPGNKEATTKVDLDNGLKGWIINNLKIKNNKYYFTATPNDTQDWLNNFREFISEHGQEKIIVVDDNDARPFLKKVIQLEYPSLVVMAQDEVMNDDEIKQWQENKSGSPGIINLPVTR